jgi:hypothetical protein
MRSATSSEPRDAEGEGRPLPGAEEADDEGEVLADHLLEEDGRPPGLHEPVGDLGDLELVRDRLAHPDELALALEQRDEALEVVVGHAGSLGGRGGRE